MYTSFIGKKFLKLYKEKYNKAEGYSAKQFFEEEFFPLFFIDNRHLMHVGNSPFFQKPKEQDTAKYGSRSLAQLQNLKTKISSGVSSGAIFVGFAAEEIQATSSGQLSTIDFKIDEEEVYASWIGEALAVGLNGGFVMLLNENEILLGMYDGWKHYRKYLQQTPHVKDKQIETWNGNWLLMYLREGYDENLINYSAFEISEVQGNIAISTAKWSQVMFALAKKYPNKVITAYCYNLSQTNTTLGFINLCLPEVFELYEFRDKVFLNKENTILTDEQIEKLETFFNFQNACKQGTIGLKALEPAQLRQYMPKGSADYAQGKEFKFSDENSYIIYTLLKLWIIAMLNKTELLQLASDVATSLIEFENDPNNRGKKDLSTLAEETRSASNMRLFIEKLTSVLDKKQVYAETFKRVIEQVLLMPSDNYPLFATLVRFEYQYQKSKLIL